MTAQPSLPDFDEHRRAPRVTVDEIKREVADYFRIPLAEMISQRRGRGVARPRQVAMYLTREHTGLSLPNIGRLFGHRDHTTVMHACRQVERLSADPVFAASVAEIEGRL
jgi:chromosomal replication initiator protein